MEKTKYEQETIISYNQEEKVAYCYTHDRALMRRLDELCEKHKEITLVRDDDGVREHTFPKKWIKVRAPKQLSNELREKMANSARERFGGAKNE